jgi:tetratricopeptide (TPR) repeat protein
LTGFKTFFSNKTDSRPEDYRPQLIIFSLALAIRLAFLLNLDDPSLFYKYPYFAEKLAAGKDIGDRLVDLSPFYLYFLTLLKKLFAIDWVYVKFMQSFIGALNSVLVFQIGRRIFSDAAGFLAALMMAAYGNLIILESTLEPTIFVLLFNLLSVYCLLLAKDRPQQPDVRHVWVFAAGIFTGLSIITKPSFLLFPAVALAWLLFGRWQRRFARTNLKSCVLLLAATLVPILPVTIRNYVKLHDVVLVTADAGKVFYRGNGKGASALEGIGLADEGFAEEGKNEPDFAHVLFRETASKISGKSLLPSESSKFWMRRTLQDIASDPAAYVKREIKKAVYFFTDYEMHYIASAYKEYKMSLQFPFLRYGVIAAFGILGMLLSLQDAKQRFLLYGMVGVYLFSGLLFIVQSRYRTPAVPYLCMFAGYAVYCIWQKAKLGNWQSAVSMAAVAAVLVFAGHHAFENEIDRVDSWQKATKLHYQLGAIPYFSAGKYNEAVNELNRCLSIIPAFSPAYNLRGKAYAVLGDYRDAERDFKQVVALSPHISHGYKNLGFLYLLQNKKDKAVAFLEQAGRLDPENKKINETLARLKDNRS